VTTSRLPRRAVVGVVLATSLIGTGAFAFAAGEGGGLGLPTKDCNTVTDPKGDGNVGSQEGLPGSFPNDPDLDITGLVFGSNDKAMTAFLRIDKLDTRSAYGDGHAFSASFTANGKAVQFTTFRFAAGQVNDGMESLPDPLTIRSSYVNIGGNSSDVPFTATYDTTNSMVILSADRAGLEKAIGGPIGTVSKILAESATDVADLGEPADEVDGKDTTWAADSNACFSGAAVAPAPVQSAAPSASPSPSPAPAPAAGGAPAAPGQPAAGCNTFSDPKGDAVISPTVGGPGMPEPDLDLTGLVLQSTPDSMRAFLRVDKLASRPQAFPGHAFYTYFTVGKKAVSMVGTAYDPAQLGQAQDGLASGSGNAVTSPQTRLVVDGTVVPSKITSTFDLKTSIVTIAVPRADLDKAVGGFADGTVLTSVYGRDSATTPAGGLFVDSTAKDNAKGATAQDAWMVGDNACFAAAAPAASPLTNVGAVKAQYGDTAAVAAKLVDAAGAPVAGKTVTFTLGSSKAVGTTGTDGVAKASLVVNEKAGSKTLVLTSGDVTTSVPFTSLVEKTALKAVNSKGNVTATLTDDDKTPVAGQSITFTLGSKKATAKTDARGVAKVSGFPAGNVKATYAGAPGMYSASSATAKS
jgi:hypothetical protein